MPCQLIFTLNALTLLQAHDDPAYAAVLAGADVSVADGIGCAWAMRRWTRKQVERVTGLELIEAMCGICVQTQQSVFLLGARPGVAHRAAQNLAGLFPGLIIAGVRDGFWPAGEERNVVAELNASGASFLLVALGQPRQEFFLEQYRTTLRMRAAMGVGGCLDVLAGDVQRAPAWVRRLGLEWLFRVIREPWRIKRIMQLPRFIVWVLFGGKRL